MKAFNVNGVIYTTMDYYFSKTVSTSYDEAIRRTTEALQSEGFGVISEIKMHDKLKEKLNVEFKKYTILGACNPPFAYKALQAEDKIGTMLPCNVLVIEQAPGEIEIAAVNPIASMMAITNPALGEIAQLVTDKLQRVIATL
ncbi:DUF302 domain-containing protein [Parabacteroides sp. FAFU027]|uniref:DUF302 domain-containing protein n=1 Tax=Parabacteroides sp. FAFU027 TaxID=2922715 RepID=UPI001FAEBFAD|nr:DUF302 domain-containing protein [Parabacteroides sp. FAFU027]